MAREMKDSGIAWIGEIPKEWEVCPIKRNFAIYAGATPKSDNPTFWDGDIAWITPADYKTEDRTIKKGRRSLTQEGFESCATYLLPVNSVIFSKRAPIGLVVINEETLCTNQGCLGCIPYDKADSVFFYYTMSAFTEQYELYGSGTTFKEISATDFANFELPVPHLSEQHLIANFLDEKCGEIDELVALQEKMIEELKAYKQSVITETVTKGLDKNVKFKDSGVDWIGEIPEDWKVCKLKNLYTLLNGRAYSDTELLEEGKYRILRVGNLFTSDKWYYSDLELEPNKYCEKNDLLYGWSASIGPTIWNDEKVIYHYHIWKVLFKPNDLRYSFYLLVALTEAKKRDMHGSAMQHLTKVGMDNSLIVYPPAIDEQHSIATYLDEKCSEIDSLISIKQKKIEALKDYKKSLIYEYVTGKKQVI